MAEIFNGDLAQVIVTNKSHDHLSLAIIPNLGPEQMRYAEDSEALGLGADFTEVVEVAQAYLGCLTCPFYRNEAKFGQLTGNTQGVVYPAGDATGSCWGFIPLTEVDMRRYPWERKNHPESGNLHTHLELIRSKSQTIMDKPQKPSCMDEIQVKQVNQVFPR